METGRSVRSGTFLVNRAEALDNMGRADKETCRRYVRQVYNINDLLSIRQSLAYVDGYYREYFEQDAMWY